MEISTFIEKFAEAIEADDASKITTETNFREMNEWNSLSYLSVISWLEDDFDIQIEGTEFKRLKTIQDIYDKVMNWFIDNMVVDEIVW